jgi:hypothetical protein
MLLMLRINLAHDEQDRHKTSGTDNGASFTGQLLNDNASTRMLIGRLSRTLIGRLSRTRSSQLGHTSTTLSDKKLRLSRYVRTAPRNFSHPIPLFHLSIYKVLDRCPLCTPSIHARLCDVNLGKFVHITHKSPVLGHDLKLSYPMM